MAGISLDSLSKVYPDGTEAVKSVSFDVADGGVMVLVGPSGCGKTTVLRMVAGLESITAGTVTIGDRVVNGLAARDRDIAMVFQNYALYPHMNVRDNMGFSLRLRRRRREEIVTRVDEAARVLALEEHLDRRPANLSGGQRQRVAMGRAIVREPQAFLMDEPLSNLDAKLRVRMRAEILRLLREVGVTTMYVTHDQTEAMTMGDAVAVMRAGVVEQLDEPRALYERPATAFVAAFIGSPAMNLFEGRLEVDEQGPHVALGDVRLNLDESTLARRKRLGDYRGRALTVGIRPEDFEEASRLNGTAQMGRVTARVELSESLGSDTLVHFGVSARAARVDVDEALELEATHRTTCVARLSGRTVVREGGTVELALDTRLLHFFDPETGVAID